VTTSSATVSASTANIVSPSSVVGDVGAPPVSFNRYSGVTEFLTCTFLWVNISEANGLGRYDNALSDGGRRIQWFAGKHVRGDSQLVEHLSSSGRGDVLLWVRPADDRGSALGPYVCLGRLRHVSHDPEIMPIGFVWELVDRDAIVVFAKFDGAGPFVEGLFCG